MQFDITFSHIAPPRTNSRVWVHAEGAKPVAAAPRLRPTRRPPNAAHPTNIHSIAKGRLHSQVPAALHSKRAEKVQFRERQPSLAGAGEIVAKPTALSLI
jgi:hypothetical protein